MSSIRSQQPPTYYLPELQIVNAEYRQLKNGIPLIVLHNNTYKVIRLDIRLRAGSYFQKKGGVALATLKTLFEGTTLHTRAQIFNAIDFQGAYLDRTIDKDFATISIHMPDYAVKDILDIVKEAFTTPSFPDSELTLLKETQKKSLAVSLEKTSVLAFREFTKTIFDTHPYATLNEIADYDAIERQDVVDFYSTHYHASDMRVFIAGNIDDTIKKLLDQSLGEIKTAITYQQEEQIFLLPKAIKKTIEKPDALQSSICIGKKLFTRTHPDWMKFSVLNMILGGYFGSRLMSEIREKKGLAYGIYSRIISYQSAGLFYIAADVNINKTNEAVEAVYKCLQTLANEPISETELNLVKNYYEGILLRQFDGIFSIFDRYVEINDYNLTIKYWKNFLRVIQDTTAEELLVLAKSYFNTDEWIEIVVGKK